MMVFAVTTTMLTLSRSGLIGIAVILIAGIMFNWQDKIEFNPIRQTLSVIRVILVFITLFMTITFLADIMRNEFPAFTRGTAGARLDLLTGNVHESNLEIRGNADMSRVTLMSGFFDAFVDKPWGHGNGYTRDQSINQLNTHNQILIYAVDYGIIGVLLFLILLMRMMLYGIQKLDLFYSIFAFLFFMECFFTHNLFFERSILVVLAFFEAKVFNAEVIQSNAAEKSTADDQD
jgi:O-antigen ligase